MRIIIFLLLLSTSAIGQVVQETNGRRADRINIFKEGLRVPIGDTASTPFLLNYSGDSARGGVVYDTTLSKLCFWTGIRWVCVDDAGGGSMTNPMTTTGDLIYSSDNSGTPARVGIGSAGQVLTVAGGLPTWATNAAAPGGGLYSIQYNRNGALAGHSTFVYDSVNNRVGIGTASPSHHIHGEYSSNNASETMMLLKNTNTGSGSKTAFEIQNDAGNAGSLTVFGNNWSDATLRNNVFFGSTKNFNIGSSSNLFTGGTDNIRFLPGGYGFAEERMRVTSSGVSIGNAINTTYYDLHIRSSNASSNARMQMQNTQSARASQIVLTGHDAIKSTILANYNSTFSSTGIFTANSSLLYSDFIGGLWIAAADAAGIIRFVTGGANTTNERMSVIANGNVLIGTTTDAASAILNVTSTTKGFLRPRMTSTQRNAIGTPAAGNSVFNTTDNTNDVYTSAWYNQPNGLKNSATLDFASTAAQTSADLTITVTGAAVGDIVMLGAPVQDANATFTAFVSATNTVTVRFNNYSAGAIDPASGSYKVYVIKN